MAPDAKPSKPRAQAPSVPPTQPGAPASENKYRQVMSLAHARKRGRGNLDEDYRRPHYEPARPPAQDDGAASPPA